MSVSIADIREAHERIDDDSVVRRTPIDTSRSLQAATGGAIHLKMEHLQRTGSFKTRGAYNKLKRAVGSEREATRAVAASAGNHAQGVALAATKTGLESTIVMPENAPQAKIDATIGYGADVTLHGHNFQEAMTHAQWLAKEETATESTIFVHAYDDPDVIAGQGTLGIELLEQIPDVDTVVVPIGGGGLIGGVAVAISELAPEARIVGVQAAGASTVHRSLQKGEPVSIDEVQTIADGIATGGIAELTYDLVDQYVDDVVTVTDTEIAESVLFMLERTKQMIEGAGATTIAAVRSDRLNVRDETVVAVLSGGNLSMNDLQTVLTHGLTYRKQLICLRVRIRDVPGQLSHLADLIAAHSANVRDVRHERSVSELNVGEAYLKFQIETSGTQQTDRIIKSIREDSYQVTRIS